MDTDSRFVVGRGMPKVTTTLMFDSAMHAQLKARSLETGQSMSSFVESAVRAALSMPPAAAGPRMSPTERRLMTVFTGSKRPWVGENELLRGAGVARKVGQRSLNWLVTCGALKRIGRSGDGESVYSARTAQDLVEIVRQCWKDEACTLDRYRDTMMRLSEISPADAADFRMRFQWDTKQVLSDVEPAPEKESAEDRERSAERRALEAAIDAIE